jgi:3-carboxy-cis,cis-muconate cycloisomerase
MTVSPFDSLLYRDLFGDAEIGQLFSDSADLRAMMLVLGSLARVQGDAGVIPQVSGRFLARAVMEVQIDPGGLTASVGENGVTVPALVAAMRKALDAPEHAQYLHWGATSQDIQDSALMLRLKRALIVIETRIDRALIALADLADAQADTPQAARTYGQVAVASSFGALVAAWGGPVLRAKSRLPGLRDHALCVSLSGAAGTGTMLGPDPAAIRAGLADALGLGDPGGSWHAARDRIAELAAWCVSITTAGGKLGEDLLRLTRSDVAEVSLAGGGASSTMPQKQNPVAPSVLVALARVAAAQNTVIGGGLHGEARDGAAWFAEWLTLPGLVLCAARALNLMTELAQGIRVDAARMGAVLDDPLGLIHAEALSFALAAQMPRAEAQALVKSLFLKSKSEHEPLPILLEAAVPGFAAQVITARRDLGQAPLDARGFAALARAAVAGKG